MAHCLEASKSIEVIPDEQRNKTQKTNKSEDLITLLKEKNRGNDFYKYRPLYEGAMEGSWETVKKFIDEHPDTRTAQINEFGETILHLAVCDMETMWLVEDILNSIPQPSLLEAVDVEDDNVLSYAVMFGNIKAAAKLVEKNESLLLKKNKDGYTPLHQAARVAHKEMLKLFLSKTKDKPTLFIGESGATLLNLLITSKSYDITLDILKQYTELDENHLIKGEVLRTLAQKPLEFESANPHLYNWCQRFIYKCIPVTNDNSALPQSEEKDYSLHSIVGEDAGIPSESATENSAKFTNSGFFQRISNGFGKVCPSFWNTMKQVRWINDIHDKKLRQMQALKLVKLICKGMISLSYEEVYKILKEPLFLAIKLGIVELIDEIISVFPYSYYFFNDNNQNIFQFAILCRQEHVSNILSRIDISRKFICTNNTDDSGNNILHLAGKLQPSSRISGAALQMQRELQWFKAIENVVIQFRPSFLEDRNQDQLTPREVFTKEHKDLVKEGQEWLKNAAQSFTVVGALIITMTFAAAFSIPGGSKSKGIPNYLQNPAFITFVVSDAAALYFSCFSVLTCLGILTSRYSEEDFLEYLPRKLILGVVTLYISLGFMMVAFFAVLWILLTLEKLRFLMLIITLVGLAILYFATLQLPLLFEILRSTYCHNFLQPSKQTICSFANKKKLLQFFFFWAMPFYSQLLRCRGWGRHI